jgi:hypothetical protein
VEIPRLAGKLAGWGALDQPSRMAVNGVDGGGRGPFRPSPSSSFVVGAIVDHNCLRQEAVSEGDL